MSREEKNIDPNKETWRHYLAYFLIIATIIELWWILL